MSVEEEFDKIKSNLDDAYTRYMGATRRYSLQEMKEFQARSEVMELYMKSVKANLEYRTFIARHLIAKARE